MEIPRHWRLKLYKGDFREKNPVKKYGIQGAIQRNAAKQQAELEAFHREAKNEEDLENVTIIFSSRLPLCTSGNCMVRQEMQLQKQEQ